MLYNIVNVDCNATSNLLPRLVPLQNETAVKSDELFSVRLGHTGKAYGA